MELNDVKKMIAELIAEYSDQFPTKNYSIRYSNRQKRALATTRQWLRMVDGKRFVYRIEFVFNNKYINSNLDRIETIKNTTLHEIAHAVVGGHHGHDIVWVNYCKSIGCNGKRLIKRGEDFNHWDDK